MSSNVYAFEVVDLSGKKVKMSEFKNKTLLIVNTASKCGFTPQYKGLNELYQKYKDNGLVVLGFPCNQFGGQEPGSSEDIKSFCDITFKIQFPLMAKIDVNGDNADPLFNYLKKELPGILGSKNIKWNFTKFLINKNGVPVKRYSPNDTPESMEKEIVEIMNS
ncbi:MAG: glutathione peroxidase [Bacteriovoracaceae bacterium]